jgi:hypothetical protein
MYKDPPFPVDLVLLNVQFKILISVFDKSIKIHAPS